MNEQYQSIVALIIVAFAATWLLRKFWPKGNKTCSSGCTCSVKASQKR